MKELDGDQEGAQEENKESTKKRTG